MVNIDNYHGPMWITILLFLLYYGFIINILRVKLKLVKAYALRGEEFDRYHSNDPEMLAADRYQLNLLEQLPPFLALLWLNAVFIDSVYEPHTTFTTTTILGCIYVVSRAFYPLVMGARLGKEVKESIMISTLPQYLVLTYYAYRLIHELM